MIYFCEYLYSSDNKTNIKVMLYIYLKKKLKYYTIKLINILVTALLFGNSSKRQYIFSILHINQIILY